MFAKEPKIEHVRYIPFPSSAPFIRSRVVEGKHKHKDHVYKIIYASLAAGLTPTQAFAAEKGIEGLADIFYKIYDILTILAEPVLMGLFVYGFILYAMEKQQVGMKRIKAAGFAYIGIVMLPGIFKLLRWVGIMLRDAVGHMT